MQVELIRFRKKHRLYSHLLLQSEELCANAAMFTHGKSFKHMSVHVHTVRLDSHYNKCLFDKPQFKSIVLISTPFLTV